MQPLEIFKKMISDISPLLKKYGYVRKGNLFYVQQNSNWSLIGFQKSQKSHADEILFTINFGIASQTLIKFFAPEKINIPPTIDECHWYKRAGALFEDGSDKWWRITEKTSIEVLNKEIQKFIFEKGIPEVERYSVDKKLEFLWLSGRCPGLTEIQRLINLSVLLKVSGKVTQLNSVLQQLKENSEGKAISFMVRQHLSNLEKNYEP